MRLATVLMTGIVCASLIINSGCVSEQKHKDLQLQNAAQERRIKELESQMQTATLELDKAKRELEATGGRNSIEMNALQQKVAALEEEIAKKKALIDEMQKQLLGATQLPAELSSMLEDWAKDSDMVSFDASKGIVKFKSDLIFKAGSDEVEPDAMAPIKALCTILNTDQAKSFDVIIVGHTDDQPILHSREKHPTNWHLSVHRAISVLNVMTGDGVAPERASVRGFGEFRPIVPNEAGNKGNPLNRRVDIYIVPKGM